jgi:hypothetical protein
MIFASTGVGIAVIITASLDDDAGQGGRRKPTKTYRYIVTNSEFHETNEENTKFERLKH